MECLERDEGKSLPDVRKPIITSKSGRITNTILAIEILSWFSFFYLNYVGLLKSSRVFMHVQIWMCIYAPLVCMKDNQKNKVSCYKEKSHLFVDF